MGSDHRKISKFLSHVLRHRPGSIGLVVDRQGWASVADLLAKAPPTLGLTTERLGEVVAQNDKQRFSLSDDGHRIRANQGHSIAVDLGLDPTKPPRVLYHGTAQTALRPIKEEGLRAMKRHHVHLSPDQQTARRVGQRHGRPVVLQVASAIMAERGFEFFRSENGVWLVDHVPPEFLRPLDDS